MSKRKWFVIATVVGVFGVITAGSALLLSPQTDNWTEEAWACVNDKYVGYWESSGNYSFKLDYENSCDRKVSCAVNVNISNANEIVKDRSVLAFSARGQTPSARSFSVPVTSLVGMANAGRKCKFV
jgi:hypothetical protein